MQGIVDKLMNMRHRSSTQNNYYTIWKLFSKFCLRLDFKPKSWEDRIILFIGYLVEDGKQSSTVHSYILRIKDILRQEGFKINPNQFLISSLTKACKIKNDCVRLRLPIQKGVLAILIKEVQSLYLNQNQPYLATLYATLLLTAYFGLFRVGELTSGSHPILAKDVQIASNKRKLMFILRTSKTHDLGNKPQIVKISSTPISVTHSKLIVNPNILPCPYHLLRKYARARGPYRSSTEPFFVFQDGAPVKPQHL